MPAWLGGSAQCLACVFDNGHECWDLRWRGRCILGWKKPGGHSTHGDRPVREYEPAVQVAAITDVGETARIDATNKASIPNILDETTCERREVDIRAPEKILSRPPLMYVRPC